MPISEFDIDLIDRYLDGNLDDVEVSKLEERRGEKEFEAYLEEQSVIREVLVSKGKDQLKSRLQDLESELSEKGKTVPFISKYKNWIVAAAAAMLIGLVGVSRWNEPNNNSLFDTYYTSYPNLVDPLTKGESKTLSPFQLYEQRDYKTAIYTLSDLPQSDEQQWYLSLSYIADGDFTSAKAIISEVLKEPNNEYYQAAQWYFSLIHLKEDEKESSIQLLTTIQNQSDHPYAAKARLLLADLE